MVWEAVFGVWVGWNRRDEPTVRRMVPVQRAANRLLTRGSGPRSTAGPPATPQGSTRRVGPTMERHCGPSSTAADTDWTGDPLAAQRPQGGRRRRDRRDRRRGRGHVPARGVTGILELAPGIDEPEWLAPDLAAAADDPGRDARFPDRSASASSPAPASGEGRIRVEPGAGPSRSPTAAARPALPGRALCGRMEAAAAAPARRANAAREGEPGPAVATPRSDGRAVSPSSSRPRVTGPA